MVLLRLHHGSYGSITAATVASSAYTVHVAVDACVNFFVLHESLYRSHADLIRCVKPWKCKHSDANRKVIAQVCWARMQCPATCQKRVMLHCKQLQRPSCWTVKAGIAMGNSAQKPNFMFMAADTAADTLVSTKAILLVQCSFKCGFALVAEAVMHTTVLDKVCFWY